MFHSLVLFIDPTGLFGQGEQGGSFGWDFKDYEGGALRGGIDCVASVGEGAGE
jgi:hypothetical protein